MVKYTGRGLVVKRPGVLSKVQMLNLVLGAFSLLPKQEKMHAHSSVFLIAATANSSLSSEASF